MTEHTLHRNGTDGEGCGGGGSAAAGDRLSSGWAVHQLEQKAITCRGARAHDVLFCTRQKAIVPTYHHALGEEFASRQKREQKMWPSTNDGAGVEPVNGSESVESASIDLSRCESILIRNPRKSKSKQIGFETRKFGRIRNLPKKISKYHSSSANLKTEHLA